MWAKFKATYDRNHDTFRVEFLLGPCALLALVINHEFTFMEILWTFSIYLEAVAILPQLFMVSKTGESRNVPREILLMFEAPLEQLLERPVITNNHLVSGEAETITSHYLFALGSYRALYILNWIYRYYAENFYDVIAIVAGVVQTVLYCDFFYLYVTKVIKGKALKLPA